MSSYQIVQNELGEYGIISKAGMPMPVEYKGSRGQIKQYWTNDLNLAQKRKIDLDARAEIERKRNTVRVIE